ncbi:cell adhesion molecule 2-like isoform X1 [Siphateles boraxobius]|uniref:cell adhesion molecule 2-like isoform X1 n=1 Tax=Siphateles boraxobius TaxID=180520 RepID=UPI004062FF8A
MMGSFHPSYFQILYLLISSLLECKAQTARPCNQVHQLNINYVQGDSLSISCLTTTHPLESLTVKLRKTNPVQHILNYSDNSPALEHQRWSVRNDTGNVTLHLKNISLSDIGHYECQVYKDWDCLNATLFNLKVKECKTLDSVHATPDSSVLLPCSEHPLQYRTDQVTWKILHGHQSTEIAQYRPPHKPSNSTERDPRPLYQRARILGNGSLLIRDAVNTDGSWYRCRVSEKTCYEVKLVMKDYGISHSTTQLETLSTTCPTFHTADSPVVHEGNIDASAEVTTNLTVVVIVTIVCLCVLITLIICVILYFKKRRSNINSKTTSNCRFSEYYSQISEGFDVPLYSLVERSTRTMTTFVAEQAEAPACIVNHAIYDI